MRTRIATCLLATAMALLSGCREREEEPRINWNPTLSHDDKVNPYGAHLAFTSLKHFFPGTTISTLSSSFRYTGIDENMIYSGGRTLLILDGLEFNLSEPEFNTLLQFVRAGNEVVLFGRSIDERLENKFGFYKLHPEADEFSFLNQYLTGRENLATLSLEPDSSKKYGYQGRNVRSAIALDSLRLQWDADTAEAPQAPTAAPGASAQESEETPPDTIVTYEESYDNTEAAEEETEKEEIRFELLGYTGTKPNMVRFSIGNGNIIVHSAPLVTSNYFLLQNDNIRYLEQIWNMVPDDITTVYWNSYYIRRSEHSDLGILWQHPGTRWALWLSILALALYVLLELKRRQRPIAVVKPLVNTSVTFAETVGRLYYNKGNHHNLAEKMVQHFLEWVRQNYYLNTNQLDNTFAHQLTAKSGLPMEVITNLLEMIGEVKVGNTVIDEAYLYHLNTTIQRFYKTR